MDIRAIDPGPCTVRHVVRAAGAGAAAHPLGRVWFVRDDIVRGVDGVNGTEGWQQADVTCALSDDGSFDLTLPNAAGADGVLHKRRFAVLTDDAYEPGEEWLEFWSDFDQERPFFVGTPTDGEKTKSTITIKGADLNAVLAGALSSEIDVWDACAPADVLRHYSRLPVLGFAATPATPVSADVVQAWGDADTPTDCWTVEASLRIDKEATSGTLSLAVGPTGAGSDLGSIVLDVSLVGDVTLWFPVFNAAHGTWLRAASTTKITLKTPATVTLRLVRRYERVFAFVNGELAAQLRRLPGAPAPSPATVRFTPPGGGGVTATLDRFSAETLLPFALRGPSGAAERILPGLPPATGLRARFWPAADTYAHSGSGATAYELTQQSAFVFPFGVDPAVDRLDPTVNYVGAAAPGMAGAFSARWTGAVYLDLEASDRELSILNGRLYVGRTLPGEEAISRAWWATGGATSTGSLRAWLGTSESGWFPIVIELRSATPVVNLQLQSRTLDGGGGPTSAFATVAEAQLSPIGCYEDVLRNTPHRTVLGDVAQTFGYQWRTLPRSLESGEFPGQYEFRRLVGRQTNVVVDDDQVGSAAVVQTAAADVVDGLVADAAGIADPQGSGQLSAQVIDYGRALGHLALRQSYESLSEITDAPLLLTRIDSLLALRSSPNEQVGVRPRGQIELVDTFPLSGDLAKMKWEPGDGVLLDLDSVDVRDESPRQLTSVSWSPRPDGIGVPTVGFRQRPRSPANALKRLRAAIFGPRRTYQGSRAPLPAAPGGTSGTVDGYSRSALPVSLKDIVSVSVVVYLVTGTAWTIEVEGVDTAIPITSPGRYDVTSSVIAAASSGEPYTYARLIGGAGGDTYLMTLLVTIRI